MNTEDPKQEIQEAPIEQHQEEIAEAPEHTSPEVPAELQRRVRLVTPSWYVLYVTPLHERKIRDAINAKGIRLQESNRLNYRIEAWVPARVKMHQWSDRIKPIEEVETPGLIFVYLKQVDKQQIYIDSHIKSFMYNKKLREPVVIPDSIMEPFRLNYTTDESMDISMEAPEIGEKVKVLVGSMRGMVGRLVRKEGHNMFRVKFADISFGVMVKQDEFVKVDEKVQSDPAYVRHERIITRKKSDKRISKMTMDQFEEKTIKQAYAKSHRQQKNQKKEEPQ